MEVAGTSAGLAGKAVVGLEMGPDSGSSMAAHSHVCGTPAPGLVLPAGRVLPVTPACPGCTADFHRAAAAAVSAV